MKINKNWKKDMLHSFEINNYKGLNNFKIDNLSQINIISGSNNVGKTALLETISLSHFNKILDFRQELTSIFESRDLRLADINIFLQTIDIILTINGEKKTIKYKNIDDLSDDEHQRVDKRYSLYEDFLVLSSSKSFSIIPFFQVLEGKHLKKNENKFINSSKPTNIDLTNLYSYIQDLGKQDRFLKYLQIIDKNITRIEPQVRGEEQSFLRVTLENPKQSLISSELGEGTNRFIEILCTLLSNSNGTVLIDEIENGIHYTKLYDIWKAIIEIVRKENIQLFVTTHDKESIEALIKASQDMDYNQVTSIKLFRNEENQIEPSIKKFELFEYGIDMGADVR